MPLSIATRPLTRTDFAPFGDVIATDGPADAVINAGWAGRWNDLARLEVDEAGRIAVGLVQAQPRTLPYLCPLLERHPDGSQAFIPMSADPFLVIVAPDQGGRPGQPLAFLTAPWQGVNYRRGTWHGVLCPLDRPGRFVVIDRLGPGANLEEFPLPEPVLVQAGGA